VGNSKKGKKGARPDHKFGYSERGETVGGELKVRPIMNGGMENMHGRKTFSAHQRERASNQIRQWGIQLPPGGWSKNQKKASAWIKARKGTKEERKQQRVVPDWRAS